jgi:hypothetical protein
MYLSRPLILSLLIALCAATVAAQSLPEKASASSQLLPALPEAEAGMSFLQSQLPFLAEEDRTNSTPDSFQGDSDSSKVSAPVRMQHILTLEQNQDTCYTLRTYRVARVSPESDTTKPAGYSTCQRSTRFQLKTAEYSTEIPPR